MAVSRGDLQVACQPSMLGGADITFLAERLSPPLAGHWMLYLASDQTAIDIRQVHPDALGHAIDTSGALGLLFPAAVSAVRVEVAAVGAESQHWRFWIGEG